MCILMVLHQQVQGYSIVLAANRDEYYDRPTRGPGLLATAPAVWGGQDERAGGTWLGANTYGLVVGLTNRRLNEQQPNDPQRRSRGLLCLDVLRCRTAAEVVAALTQEPPERYNPFNLLIADQHEILWIAYFGTPQTRRLNPGLHILSNGDINDFETVRIRRARHLLRRTDQATLETILPVLEEVCRDHETGVQDRETICMHRENDKYGTVSSTILAISANRHDHVYRYASGHPCAYPYAEYSALLHPIQI